MVKQYGAADMKASRLVILALLVILLLGGLPDLCSAIAGPGRRLAVRGSVAGDESEDPSDFNSDDLEDYDDEDEEDGKPKETIAQVGSAAGV